MVWSHQPGIVCLQHGRSYAALSTIAQVIEEAFITSMIIVKDIAEGGQFFNKAKAICIVTDRSKDGIGFWTFQEYCKCLGTKPFCCKVGWKITLVPLTQLNPDNYVPIEGEVLTMADALDKVRFFIPGCTDLTVVVDHKPFIKITHLRISPAHNKGTSKREYSDTYSE